MFGKKISFDYPFVDIHSHILYGVDDGSRDEETSMKMLQIAYNENIREIIVTPHFHPAKCTIILDKQMESFNKLQEMALHFDENFKIHMGREVYYATDVLDIADERNDLTMNKGIYMLVEYSPGVDRSYLNNSVVNILQGGFTPIIAHIERYACAISDLSFILDLKQLGALIQVNSASVIGEYGNETQRAIKAMLKKGLVDLIASDAHSAGKRSPKLMDCMTFIAKRYGEDYARKLIYENPKAIINSEEI